MILWETARHRRSRTDSSNVLIIAARLIRTDARQIIDFRNIIVHGYYAIKHETVWRILEKDQPVLIDSIDQLLK